MRFHQDDSDIPAGDTREYQCESGAELQFTWTGDRKYPVRLTVNSNTGSASLTNGDMDYLSAIFRKLGPWFI